MSWSPTGHHQWQPLPESPQGNRSVLDFSDAMHTFQSMFPNMDDEVIEQVLRSHGGNVDQTIDTLLTMSSAKEEEESAAPSLSHRAPKSNDVHTRVEDVSDLLIPLDDSEGLVSRSRWKPAMLRPLPADFLVIAGVSSVDRQETSTGSSTMLHNLSSDTLSRRLRENEELRVNAATAGMDDGDLQAFLEDERLAIMLQNEEFVKMLSQDEDFMEAVSREQALSVPPAVNRGGALPLDHPYYHESRQEELNRLQNIGAFHYKTTANRPMGSANSSGHRRLGPDITKNMTKGTKVKLAKLAKKFFSKKGYGSKKASGLPLSPNSRSTLSSAGAAPLLEEDELAHTSSAAYHMGAAGNSYGRL